jgi:hypothetical protein
MRRSYLVLAAAALLLIPALACGSDEATPEPTEEATAKATAKPTATKAATPEPTDDQSKEIQGVRTVVAWIEDFSEGELVEKEIAFYAQDNDGNVWYFGEHPEEYKSGRFIVAPTWIAGYADARPGIKMWADPNNPGAALYYQGWGPAVEWTDYAQVDQVGQETCVAAGCYQDVLVLAESSLGEFDIYQIKYYARGVGEVKVGWRGPTDSAEDLELVEFTQLGADAVAQVRAQALALEAHAYEVSNYVYGQTAPSQ